MNDCEQDQLYSLLKEVQLEHFYNAIKAIDVTKVEHFENVVFEDLTNSKVGMGAPAARRLLEAAKRRNNKWKKNLLNIILPIKPKDREDKTVFHVKTDYENSVQSDNIGLTCLIPNKDIKLLDKIGDGSFGVVMRAQWTQVNKSSIFVAVKVLKQEVLLRALEDFAKEVNAMHQLKHPNLIKLYGIVLSSPMMMVTELAEQGSLRAKLIKTLGRVSISTIVDYAIQIGNGMKYLESKRLIHRDLATRNIFITSTNVIKIGDFGLMRSVPCDEDYYTMSDNIKVPFPWCAIESLKYRQFSHASDTWMYGVTLWEIFSFGQEPWAGLNGSQIIQKLDQNERLALPDACPQKIYQVMCQCWSREPKDRPTFEALIKFFEDHKPIKLKAVTSFDNSSTEFTSLQSSSSSSKSYLKITVGDEIEVIEGKPENYWWKGQSQRSFNVGVFPRCVAKDLRAINSNSISKPLKNSFVHTGHMDPLGAKSWGNPEYIEKMYLEHPIDPPDVMGFESDSLPILKLDTRNGTAPTVYDNKIDKITSLDELVAKPVEAKEGILIDFSVEDEQSMDSLPPAPEPPLATTNNDLNGITFESVNDPFDTSSVYQDELIRPIPEQKIDLQTLSKTFDEVKLDTLIDSSSRGNMFSKYYAPPIDNCEVQFDKSRYYSSVCSNCDFTNEFSCNSISIGENICKCCGEYYSYNNPCTNECLPPPPPPLCNESCTGTLCKMEATLYPTYPTCNNGTFPDHTNTNTAKPTFQTAICKEFIEKLEANFSSISSVKVKEPNGFKSTMPASSTTVYPVLNPPPRSYKTRRPAPPPPISKKN